MITHCMAINRDVFEAAGALQYLNEETRTWNSVEDFFKAVQAVYDAGHENVGVIYCGGQGGDQGTRALITNIGGGTYSNADHTAYTYASTENATALSKLYAQDGIDFNPAIVASDEITAFVNGTLKMAFCWNISQEVNNADALGFDVLPMAFPSDSTPSLQGGIWGFGVFNNGNEAKIEAAKTFIKFMTESDDQYFKAVKASTFAPCRDLANSGDLNPLLPEYMLVAPMMGDYYQITTNWTNARTEWWNMLQRVMDTDGSVEAILAEMQAAQDAANAG
jgi:multiple sugar transport system substrate-binding protein